MMTRLDAFKLKHLRMLVALEEHGKVGSVAGMFGLSQPSLSRTLVELESLAGHRLFERHNRGTALTPEGKVLARYARTLLAEAARAEYDMKVIASGKRGSVSIGTVMTPASEIVVPALNDAQAGYQDLDINVSHGSSDALLAQLSAGSLDFAICRLPENFNRTMFDYEPLGEETFRMVVARGHPLAAKPAVEEADLEGLDWVLQPEGSYLRDVMDDYHRAQAIVPRSVISTSSVLMTILLVKSSGRVGIFAKTVAEMLDQHQLLTALPIHAHIDIPGFGLVQLKGKELSPQARSVFEALRQKARERKTWD
jgi:DNA-binding transcriptional LysR family regulator